MASNRDFDDDPDVFDETEDERQSEGSSLLMAIVISLLILVAFGGVVWLAYNSGVARGHEEVMATKGLPASSTVGSALDENKIQDKAGEAPDSDGAAPPPQPQQPAAQPPMQPAAQPPAPVAPPKPVKAEAAPAKPAIEKSAEKPVEKPVAKPGAKPAPITAAKTVANAPVNLVPPAKAAAKPAVPANAPAAKVPAKFGAPVNLVPAKAAAKPAAATTAPAKSDAKSDAKPDAKPATGSGLLQIGAYKSESEATAAWQTYKAKHGALLAGLGPNIQKVDLGDKGTWYRLRIGGVGGKDAAAALCDKLKAAGGVCIPAH